MTNREERNAELENLTEEELLSLINGHGIEVIKKSKELIIAAILSFEYGYEPKQFVNQKHCPECNENSIPMSRIEGGTDNAERRFEKMNCSKCGKDWKFYFDTQGNVEFVERDE